MIKNINISELKEITPPFDTQVRHQPLKEDIDFISQSRLEIDNILKNRDPRFLVIVGPCSIHDYDSAITYAKQLKEIKDSNPNLYIVMRVYFEKPRSRTGWKGFIYDPELDNSYNINKGLDQARKLLLEIVQLRIPVGCEFLDPITPQYISDLVSWGAIGARTSESQIHRQLASGLSMPIGFKNLTSGDVEKAINGIISAQVPHNFIGIDDYGKVSHIITKGNTSAHLILRGGDEPNYQQPFIEQITKSLEKESIETGIIVDCSHGNSQSNYNRQILAAIFTKRLFMLKKYPVRGIMIESNINKGNQKLIRKEDLKHGISITDACIDIETTATLLSLLNSMNVVKISSLSEVRKLIREYDQQISSLINGNPITAIKRDIVLTNHMFELDKLVEQLCRNQETLSMLVSLRFALSEKVAEIKYKNAPFSYLNRSEDFLKLVTDREIEKTNLKLFNHPLYLKVMEQSKIIQVSYLEAFTKTVKIGYLYGKGTFSSEVVKNFRGIHIDYPSLEALKKAFDSREVDYIVMPTYNSLIGEIFQPESYWEPLGSIDHKIDLCLYSNNKNPCPKTLYLETHVEKESRLYIDTHYPDLRITQVKSSLEGCLKCIQDPEDALTISSKNNKSNFLYTLKEDIVEHNITTFSLYGFQ
jgi:3-deoxy-7-phosphoheptulonate synthase